ncbi:MAG: phosphoglucosamine mutase [Bacteroidetes bacterium HGW-Bacteroidetes-21]|jgi:phosphomannomutase|nr:MAG: phosphoglucosamine mutase [Bacteroidetes bacterium HGW-Bacteroidetes-21]
MTKIKFGTDGWRAIIAREFTVENVAKVTIAASRWLLKKYKNPSVVIGYDCRFGGKMFSETVAKVFAHSGIKVYFSTSFVPTPAVSLAISFLEANMGVVITASHNPPDYNGYKLKGSHGGPLMEDQTREIEAMIPEELEILIDSLKWDDLVAKGFIIETDVEKIYIDHLKNNFDIKALKKSKFKFAFEAMYGAGQDVMRKLMPDIELFHCDYNPSFKGIAPEPLEKNLKEFQNAIATGKKIDCGLAVDGDADRIALFDKHGNYIDSHNIILLLIYYLAGFKKQTGSIVTGFSSTSKVEQLAWKYGLEVKRVRIGFKDICKIMLEEDVLVGGEESGGIAIRGHIPERDGIWMGLTLWTFMMETGKNIDELLQEVHNITGNFSYTRIDLKVDENVKKDVLNRCKNNNITSFGKYKVDHLETLDGFKYFLNESEWLMIRPSGTEPLLRLYAEAETPEKVADILKKALDFVNKK